MEIKIVTAGATNVMVVEGMAKTLTTPHYTYITLNKVNVRCVTYVDRIPKNSHSERRVFTRKLERAALVFKLGVQLDAVETEESYW